MIRYFITEGELKARVKALKPGWLDKAREMTEKFRSEGKYPKNTDNIWTDIKDVFLDLQYNKCAYCERRLGGKSYNRSEYDVEHYRPKNAVKAWPNEAVKLAESERGSNIRNYDFALGEATDTGYYLLALNVRNYAVACKGCNSVLKSNYFPVAKNRVLDSDDYDLLKTEEPYLLCPVGDVDDDNPEDIITFIGYVPVTKESSGARYRRGRVTIDFFDLALWEELILERASIIVTIWLARSILLNPAASSVEKAMAQLKIDEHTSPQSPHTNCAKAFVRLCRENPARADKCVEEATPQVEKLLKRQEKSDAAS